VSEHYTRDTEEAEAWCNHCWRYTRHKVSAGRLAECLEHSPPELTVEQRRRLEQRAHARQNRKLFSEEG
jgi:hypothetical protein